MRVINRDCLMDGGRKMPIRKVHSSTPKLRRDGNSTRNLHHVHYFIVRRSEVLASRLEAVRDAFVLIIPTHSAHE